jgi:hypothetical protein
MTRGTAVEGALSLEVELSILSGLPNPAWNLTAEQERHFLRTLRGLTRVHQPWSTPQPRLGYQGFLVEDDDAGVEFWVTEGKVYEEHDDGTQKVLLDRNRQLERGLVDSDLFSEAESELGAGGVAL